MSPICFVKVRPKTSGWGGDRGAEGSNPSRRIKFAVTNKRAQTEQTNGESSVQRPTLFTLFEYFRIVDSIVLNF